MVFRSERENDFSGDLDLTDPTHQQDAKDLLAETTATFASNPDWIRELSPKKARYIANLNGDSSVFMVSCLDDERIFGYLSLRYGEDNQEITKTIEWVIRNAGRRILPQRVVIMGKTRTERIGDSWVETPIETYDQFKSMRTEIMERISASKL